MEEGTAGGKVYKKWSYKRRRNHGREGEREGGWIEARGGGGRRKLVKQLAGVLSELHKVVNFSPGFWLCVLVVVVEEVDDNIHTNGHGRTDINSCIDS